jgi:oligoribonuclease
MFVILPFGPPFGFLSLLYLHTYKFWFVELQYIALQIATKMSATKSSQTKRGILWVDIETTGLNVETDVILEVAMIATDNDLNELGSIEVVIQQPQEVLDNMNDWCKKQHGGSGLTKRCLESTTTLEEATQKLLDFVKQHFAERSVPMAGSSVGFDRKFLERYMPSVEKYTFYRNIDVSTLLEIYKRKNPLLIPESGPTTHRAMDDIRKSIKYYEHYLKLLFPPPPELSTAKAEKVKHIHIHLSGSKKRTRVQVEEDSDEEPQPKKQDRESNKKRVRDGETQELPPAKKPAIADVPFDLLADNIFAAVAGTLLTEDGITLTRKTTEADVPNSVRHGMGWIGPFELAAKLLLIQSIVLMIKRTASERGKKELDCYLTIAPISTDTSVTSCTLTIG